MNTPVETFPKNQVAFPRWIEAGAVVGAFLAAIVILAMASSHSTQPAQAATQAQVPEHRAVQGQPQRSGTLAAYKIVF
jgi:hypothetical protein